MDNLVNFPTKAVRDWKAFDKTFRSSLTRRTQLSAAAIDDIMKRVRPIWDKYQHRYEFSYSLPSLNKSDADKINASIHASVDAFQRELGDFQCRLLLDRVGAEIEINLLEHHP